MLQKQKIDFEAKWLSKFIITVITIVTIAAAYQTASAQVHPEPTPPPPGCDLSLLGQVDGDTLGFTVTPFDSKTISIQIVEPETTAWGLWGSVQASSLSNVNVSISTPTANSKDVVYVTASKIDPNLSAGSFVITATTTFNHHITFNVEVNCPSVVTGCTLTQGYWKNKPAEWPVASLNLGTQSYNKTQLISILKTPVRGNGLVSLSHQLIAAKINFATGATVPPNVLAAIGMADGMIGGLIVPSIGTGFLSTDSTSALTSTLDTFNNGRSPGGPPHCED